MNRRPVRWRTLAGVLVATLAAGACGSSQGPAGQGTADTEVRVFAAASLADAFADIGDAFSAGRPETTVVVNAAGSQTLARQIADGAPADVFAAADVASMEAVEEHLAATPEVFATNRLSIAVERGNPRGVRRLADLADPDLVVVLAAEQVPAGAYTRAVLDAAGVTVDPASLEDSVRGALERVALGEADAAVVYATDVVSAADRVDAVDVPAGDDVRVVYPIAVLKGARDADAARALVDFVRGEQGQAILAAHGFSAP